jgi:hypothetical protein
MDLVLDVSLAILFALGLFGALWVFALLLRPADISATDAEGLGMALARAARPGPVAAALAAGIAAFAALGWATLVEDVDLPALVINREGTIPTFFSSALLLVAGALAILLGADERPGQRWWVLWGILLMALGLDEGAEVHERLEVRLGLPAPVVLGPVGVLAAIAYLKTLAMTPAGSLARRLYLAGATAWAAALLSDVVHGVDWKSVLEEVLEMSGSAMMLLALLVMVRAR